MFAFGMLAVASSVLSQ